MSSFDLQDWLDDQLEHNILYESTGFDNFQDVDVGGFGFPHYADHYRDDLSNPGTNPIILL